MAVEMINNALSRASMGYGTYAKNANSSIPSKAKSANYVPEGENNMRGATEALLDNKRVSENEDAKRRFDSYECETCENRRYQDGSDDSGVSCQTPTKFSPETAAARVRGHEQEHVVRNQAKAEREGDEIVSQSVTLHTGICPECGKVYISGGTTETTIRKGADKAEKFNVGLEDSEKGGLLDVAV